MLRFFFVLTASVNAWHIITVTIIQESGFWLPSVVCFLKTTKHDTRSKRQHSMVIFRNFTNYFKRVEETKRLGIHWVSSDVGGSWNLATALESLLWGKKCWNRLLMSWEFVSAVILSSFAFEAWKKFRESSSVCQPCRKTKENFHDGNFSHKQFSTSSLTTIEFSLSLCLKCFPFITSRPSFSRFQLNRFSFPWHNGGKI